MKNATTSGTILSRLMKPAALALLALSLLSTVPAFAAGHDPKEVPAEVKYVGTLNGKPTFQLNVNNPQGEEVALALRDENGTLIYADTIKDKSYTRKLQFDDFDADNLKVVLTLRTKKDVQKQTFEITRNTRTVEDVAVVNL